MSIWIQMLYSGFKRENHSHSLETTMTISIADLFAARLAELQEKELESQRKINETIANVKSLIAELEAIEFPEV